MKMNSCHEYHGITLRDDGTGWWIQISVLGKYRQFRAYTWDVEEAARRHDLAVWKLEAFTSPSTVPNFPDLFSGLTLTLPDDAPDDLKEFVASVKKQYAALCSDVTSAGGDVELMLSNRRASAADVTVRRAAKKSAALNFVRTHLSKAESRLTDCGLDAENMKKAQHYFAEIRAWLS